MQVYTQWISPLKVQLDRIESEFQKFITTFKKRNASSSPFDGDSGHAPLNLLLKALVIIILHCTYLSAMYILQLHPQLCQITWRLLVTSQVSLVCEMSACSEHGEYCVEFYLGSHPGSFACPFRIDFRSPTSVAPSNFHKT